MSDKTIENITSGKGLQPLPNSSNSNPGRTIEQRSDKGITHETFTYNGDKTNKNKNQ